jgi:hypothetical protein
MERGEPLPQLAESSGELALVKATSSPTPAFTSCAICLRLSP